jgi:hypothetical protein
MRHVARIVPILLAAIFIVSTHCAAASPDNQSRSAPVLRCAGNPHLVGACFNVRGRLNTKNGGPAIPLWIIGTKRMLGVMCPAGTESDCSALPAHAAFVADQLPGTAQTFGDFKVCPFTVSRPGWMQFVCVEKASHLIVEKWDDATKSFKYSSGPSD